MLQMGSWPVKSKKNDVNVISVMEKIDGNVFIV